MPEVAHVALDRDSQRAVAAHMLDFDDVHMSSTSHASQSCHPRASGAAYVEMRPGRTSSREVMIAGDADQMVRRRRAPHGAVNAWLPHEG